MDGRPNGRVPLLSPAMLRTQGAQPGRLPDPRTVAGIVLAVAVGAGLGKVGGSLPASRISLAAAGFLIAAFLLALGLWRPAVLAAVGFALLPVVRREPAPVDVAFAALVFAVLLAAPGRIKLRPGVATAVAAFAGVTVLSTANANDISRALQYEWTTLYLVAAGIVMSAIFWNETTARRCITAYIAAASASSILGVLALFVHFPGSHALLYDPHRTMAFFKDPNVFSGFLVPGIAILVDELADPKLLPWRLRTKVAALGTLAAGLLFAFSRAAFLNAAIAVFVVLGVNLARRGGLRYALRLLGPIVVVGVLGYGLLAAAHQTHFLESRSHLQAYDAQRFATQSEALHDATRHLFGFGPGQVEVNLPLASHSLYARVAYEQGVPGLVTMIGLFGMTLVIALALAFRSSRVGVGGAALAGTWCGVLANSFFIDTLHWRHVWLFAGLIWANLALRDRGEVAIRPFARSPESAPAMPDRLPRPRADAHRRFAVERRARRRL
jgi:hypothetical protein